MSDPAPPRAGDEVDQRRIRIAVSCMAALVASGLGFMMGFRAMTDACDGPCYGYEFGMVGIAIAFAAVACYSGARGSWTRDVGSAVASSMLFALAVLHLASDAVLGIHLYVMDVARVGSLLWFGWWTLVAGLGVAIWEGLHAATLKALGNQATL